MHLSEVMDDSDIKDIWTNLLISWINKCVVPLEDIAVLNPDSSVAIINWFKSNTKYHNLKSDVAFADIESFITSIYPKLMISQNKNGEDLAKHYIITSVLLYYSWISVKGDDHSIIYNQMNKDDQQIIARFCKTLIGQDITVSNIEGAIKDACESIHWSKSNAPLTDKQTHRQIIQNTDIIVASQPTSTSNVPKQVFSCEYDIPLTCGNKLSANPGCRNTLSPYGRPSIVLPRRMSSYDLDITPSSSAHPGCRFLTCVPGCDCLHCHLNGPPCIKTGQTRECIQLNFDAIPKFRHRRPGCCRRCLNCCWIYCWNCCCRCCWNCCLNCIPKCLTNVISLCTCIMCLLAVLLIGAIICNNMVQSAKQEILANSTATESDTTEILTTITDEANSPEVELRGSEFEVELTNLRSGSESDFELSNIVKSASGSDAVLSNVRDPADSELAKIIRDDGRESDLEMYTVKGPSDSLDEVEISDDRVLL